MGYALPLVEVNYKAPVFEAASSHCYSRGKISLSPVGIICAVIGSVSLKGL